MAKPSYVTETTSGDEGFDVSLLSLPMPTAISTTNNDANAATDAVANTLNDNVDPAKLQNARTNSALSNNSVPCDTMGPQSTSHLSSANQPTPSAAAVSDTLISVSRSFTSPSRSNNNESTNPPSSPPNNNNNHNNNNQDRMKFANVNDLKCDSPYDEAKADSILGSCYSSELFKESGHTTTNKIHNNDQSAHFPVMPSLATVPSLLDRETSSSTRGSANNDVSNVNIMGGSNDLVRNIHNMQQHENGSVEVNNHGVKPQPMTQTNPKPESLSPSQSPSPSYYTTQPKSPYPILSLLFSPLTFAQQLREYRHNTCFMTPLSSLVLLALILSSLIGLLLAVPQFALGLLLGPLLKRNMWMVEFLYRYNIARWGHVKIMKWGAKSRNNNNGSSETSPNSTKSGTLSSSQGNNNNNNNNNKRNDNLAVGHKKSSSSTTIIQTTMQSSSSLGANNAIQKKLERLGIAGHSQTIHQRITVIPNRVYIHPIPQFMDNISYLIVCCPPHTISSGGDNNNVNGSPVLGVLVDCGESHAILGYLECIYEMYYGNYPRSNAFVAPKMRMGIALHAILCTHRHHDHTAGVRELVDYLESIRHEYVIKDNKAKRGNSGGGGGSLVNGGMSAREGQGNVFDRVVGNVIVVGGAVERVPHQNLFAKNGCFVPLPCIDDNDMNRYVSIEVIGVPSHTRGSVVYALRNRVSPDIAMQLNAFDDDEVLEPLQSHLFSGDAIFSGGGGVPFEADLENASDNFIKNPKSLQFKNGSTKFRPGAGTLSMERCFAEVLVRANGSWISGSDGKPGQSSPQTALYPGHEYTTDLIMRQFDQKNVAGDERWVHLPPSTFFETASHYFVSAHRRALAHKSKLLTIPLPLKKEQVVNPNFRSLKRRGEHLVNALKLWYEFGAKKLIPDMSKGMKVEEKSLVEKNATRHSGAATDNQSIFTTMYTNDLELLVEELRSGRLNPALAADRLESLQVRLDEKTIGRRPIPNTLPCHKNVYLGILALVVLGSNPSAVTVSDAVVMNMAEPVDNTDRILISRQRLVVALNALDLHSEDPSIVIEDIIALLWKEAKVGNISERSDEMDVEYQNNDDTIELGLLKLELFGVTFNQKSKICLPCGSQRPTYSEKSWVKTSRLKRTKGELVRHDAERCLLCRDVLKPCPYDKNRAASVAI